MAGKVKLTEEMIQAICARKSAAPHLSQIDLAAEFGLDRKIIAKALMRLDTPATTAPAESGRTMLALETIHTSPLNPRKTFEPEELAELAESIAVNGLLQNLVVRPAENGFTLVAGERRLRAITHLAETGRWSGPVPCLIIAADDAAHVALALLENLHRQDVAPLEEADAFAQLQALDPDAWSAPAIALRIGRTPRYVYQRLALANNLCDDAKTLLRAGMLNVEGARLMASEPPDVQEKILARQWSNWTESDADVFILKIEPDDDPLTAAEIRGEISYFTRQAENLRLSEARAAERAERLANGGDDDGDEGNEDNEDEQETSEQKSLRLKAQADREAAWKARAEAEEARRAAAIAELAAVAYHLPTDWPADEERTPSRSYCNDGCKYRRMLTYSSPSDFHVCLNPNSPRAGLLTHEEQGGRDCFVVG